MSRDSRHDGVSCDSCLKGNFRGRRYKCLICYDYDLCDTCYEAGATTSRHTIDHPMQCILTRTDFGLYYGGETLLEQPQSFTCPFCAKMGFTESTLQEHVSANHTDVSTEVVCPVCASQPQGEPNHVTDDFAAHLSLEHRAPRDLISFHDEPAGSRHVRRIPHPGRGVTSSRARRTNMHFGNSSGVSVLSPGNRESMDPIAELLSQLSGVRRVTGLSSNSTSQQNTTSSQLQQLQVHLQLERQQAQMARQHLERLPRRQAGGKEASNTMTTNNLVLDTVDRPPPSNSMFLLARYSDPVLSDGEQAALEVERADHSQFMQELLLSALSQNLVIDDVVTPAPDDLAEAASSKTNEATAAVSRTDTAHSSSPLLPTVTQTASDSKITSSNTTAPSMTKSTGESQQRTGAKRNPRRQGADAKKKGREPPPPHPK